MGRKIITILLLIALSEASTMYGIFLILTFQYTVVNGSNSPSMVAAIVMPQPYFLIPVSIGVMGWLATVYEVVSLKKGQFTGTLRKKMSSKGFDRSVYRLFSTRGGSTRLAIMNALDSPKLRNEVANITNKDWKEVDRNIKILESANLVKKQFSHGSMSVYDLTETGKELIGILQGHTDESSHGARGMHS